jgi:NADP-dependent 3-hydroxy acid dehydrogenase YdfG
MRRTVGLSGSKVLLTGATGQAIARELSSRGAQLVLTGRRTDVLDPLSTELGATSIAADLASPPMWSSEPSSAGTSTS